MAQVATMPRTRTGDRTERTCTARLDTAKPSRDLRAYADNASWFVAHVDDLRSDPRYSGRYVAVDQGSILTYSSDLRRLLRSLERRLGSDRTRSVFIRHVASEPHVTIL